MRCSLDTRGRARARSRDRAVSRGREGASVLEVRAVDERPRRRLPLPGGAMSSDARRRAGREVVRRRSRRFLAALSRSLLRLQVTPLRIVGDTSLSHPSPCCSARSRAATTIRSAPPPRSRSPTASGVVLPLGNRVARDVERRRSRRGSAALVYLWLKPVPRWQLPAARSPRDRHDRRAARRRAARRGRDHHRRLPADRCVAARLRARHRRLRGRLRRGRGSGCVARSGGACSTSSSGRTASRAPSTARRGSGSRATPSRSSRTRLTWSISYAGTRPAGVSVVDPLRHRLRPRARRDPIQARRDRLGSGAPGARQPARVGVYRPPGRRTVVLHEDVFLWPGAGWGESNGRALVQSGPRKPFVPLALESAFATHGIRAFPVAADLERPRGVEAASARGASRPASGASRREPCRRWRSSSGRPRTPDALGSAVERRGRRVRRSRRIHPA